MLFSKKKLVRHVVLAIISVFLYYLFYVSRSDLASLHRILRATGDLGFILLFATLAIGPLAKIWKPATKLLPWRRQAGIWFALAAIAHSILALDGWIEWDWLRFFGYEYLPQLGRYARLEPGFGLANILGAIALFWTVILLATSSDSALKFLGGSAWKWIQNAGYVIFYLTGAHAVYFLFIHFTISFHKNPFPPNWIRYYVVALMIILLI
ncbi:ferric reductase-like transmembrane domain-containing protein, partial [Candidatus Woesearchaeota archaeon]|nr:ferric reductase-like transmembrane domain-containing protein [Candidatus Woesearchaeota archaeon]